MECKLFKNFDLLRYLTDSGVQIVGIPQWQDWVIHVTMSWGVNCTNPASSKVLKSLAVKYEWTHPDTKNVYDPIQNSDYDAYHTIIAYLRTTFMLLDVAQAFNGGERTPHNNHVIVLFIAVPDLYAGVVEATPGMNIQVNTFMFASFRAVFIIIMTLPPAAMRDATIHLKKENQTKRNETETDHGDTRTGVPAPSATPEAPEEPGTVEGNGGIGHPAAAPTNT
ncbi:hypothetical protein PG997_010541 [Apiospora hydei]|uniref:Uncharacterized protein n=1 Tax=Apiospora hydei TaxID=1337664 RepID=A0ABR1VXB4_9PEZI